VNYRGTIGFDTLPYHTGKTYPNAHDKNPKVHDHGIGRATRFEHKPICWVYDEMTIATRGHKPTGIRFGGTNLYGWKCHLYYNQQRIKKQT